MKKVLVIHLGEASKNQTITFLKKKVELRSIGCQGNISDVKSLIREFDGKVDAIALEGMPAFLELGRERRSHRVGESLLKIAKKTPVVDGSGIRAGLERWAITLTNRAEPGIFSQKRVLMTPGLNHPGLSQALSRHCPELRYADPMIFFGLPGFPGVGNPHTLEKVAAPTLEMLKDSPFHRLHPCGDAKIMHRPIEPFLWADVLAGDIALIRCYAPEKLHRKIVVVENATGADMQALRERGVSILITLMPSLNSEEIGQHPASTIEALLVASRANTRAPLSEDTYLDLFADVEWTPAIQYLQPEEKGINRFAFVIHPLNLKFIHKHPTFRWTRYLPGDAVENIAAFMPPMYISRITGGKSPATGLCIEGLLISLGATPRQMMKHGERFTYNRLIAAAKMAERKGARIMGLGAFTSVVGDAGITVANEAGIAITSGNSLTVAATLEAAKQAVKKMGATDLKKGRAMVVGATGSIGSVCSRLIARAIFDIVLVSIEPERLIDLKRIIKKETPKAKVTIATRADDYLGECDLVVSTTSAFGQRVIDISKCKPGAVICDVARPPDVNESEAALRPDVLVIESGEVRIPGDIDIGYDIGLPPKTVYACLAETALLAMDGRFESYTLGRNLSVEKVKEIYRLFKKHQFQIADLRSFEKVLTDQDFAKKRALAAELRRDSAKFEVVKSRAAAKLATMPVMAKGVAADPNSQLWKLTGVAAAFGAVTLWLNARRKK